MWHRLMESGTMHACCFLHQWQEELEGIAVTQWELPRDGRENTCTE
jgi:hypothetical protein